jgi:diguanylate cyclase (GGDEF)-like protein
MSLMARRIVFRASSTTLVAVALTFALFHLERAVIGVPFTALDIIEVTLLPVAVGFPIALFVFWQTERLRQAYAELAALHQEAANARDRLRQANAAILFASTHDGMTGLFNRTHFLRELDAAYLREDSDVLLIADADNFKQVNDTLGHLAGDDALVRIADAIRGSVRDDDLVGRIGGEEFGILLRGTSPSSAAEIAESIRRRVEAIPWVSGHLTVSIGGAAFADYRSGVTEVFVQADRCLYEAKRAGRNCIALHPVLSDVASAMAKQSAEVVGHEVGADINRLRYGRVR